MRATEAEIKNVVDTSLTEEQVTPFLRTANVLMDRAVLAGGGTYAAADLRETEIWLAAYLLCSRDPRVKSETTDDAFGTYDVESYWAKVVLLDPTGRLAGMKDAKIAARVWAL